MYKQTPKQIVSEIEALRARIRRLRLECRVAALADAERKLLRLAERPEQTDEVKHDK